LKIICYNIILGKIVGLQPNWTPQVPWKSEDESGDVSNEHIYRKVNENDGFNGLDVSVCKLNMA
jgi:hypothetical protein